MEEKKICSVEGCGLKSFGRGFCQKHYNSWYWMENRERLLISNSRYYNENKEHVLLQQRKRNKEYCKTVKSKFSRLKGIAKSRGYLVEISIEFFEKLIENSCYYCGEKLPITGSGVDRKDNLLNYTESNCVPCCTICNKMKNTMTVEEFKNKISALYKNFLEENNE
jgi:hypothetical protein